MSKKVMISQPMAGKTDEEIVSTREKAIKVLESKGYEVVNTLFTDEWYSNKSLIERGVVQIPLCFLAKSLENMSLCHVAYFCKGWEKARGCRIENEVALAYGLEIIYEETNEKTTTEFGWRLLVWGVSKGLEEDGYPEGTQIIDSMLPEEGEEVLISDFRGFMYISSFLFDDDGVYLDNGIDVNNVRAWSYLPEPYEP